MRSRECRTLWKSTVGVWNTMRKGEGLRTYFGLELDVELDCDCVGDLDECRFSPPSSSSSSSSDLSSNGNVLTGLPMGLDTFAAGVHRSDSAGLRLLSLMRGWCVS